LDSFVSVEAGTSGNMRTLSTLCGDQPGVYRLKDVKAFSVTRYKLTFVSGSIVNAHGFRGFNFTVTAVEAKSDLGTGLIAIYVIAAIFFIMVMCVGAALVRRKTLEKTRRRERRRRPTWHGNVPAPGVSLHVSRTLTLNQDIEGASSEPNVAAATAIDLSCHQAREENIYNDSEEESIHYSVPMRGGRRLTLPAPPDDHNDLSDEEVKVNNNNIKDVSSTTCKIYETLTSNSSVSSFDSQPSVPKRPEWTLQVPDDGQANGSSPLYLMMPAPESSKQESSGVFSNETLTNVTNNSSNEARKSISDTAKKILQRFSKSFSSNPEHHQTLCDKSDSDSDNVFC